MTCARFVLAASLVLSATSCTSDEHPFPGTFAQCEDHPAGIGTSEAAVEATVNAFVPPGAAVRCSDSTAFTVDGNEVRFVFVAYGELQDCPAGCFTSEVCAVHDAGGVLLYAAAWNGQAEEPSNLPAGCPAPAAGGDTRSCDPPAPGTAHPLTQTSAFTAFQTSQGNGTGAWRFCFF